LPALSTKVETRPPTFSPRGLSPFAAVRRPRIRIEHEKSEQQAFDPIIKDLVASLHPTGSCN
jgi:hypothetical protein